MHEYKCFITLTFNDQCLPVDCSVDVRHLQLFMKRLRKFAGRSGIRYFACGEYGETNYRPHYHILLFGFEFDDCYPWRRSASGNMCYRSAKIEKLWPYGHVEIGNVTLQSAGYVARYILKKVKGDDVAAAAHYTRVHPVTGEVCRVKPEFVCMSKGIGRDWFDNYVSEVFPSDFVVVDGQKRAVPRYYTKRFAGQVDDVEREAVVFEIKLAREVKARRHDADMTTERMDVRREVTERRVARLKRELD